MFSDGSYKNFKNMRIDRFFVQDKIEDKTLLNIIDEGVIHQWRKVLRYKPETIVELCDNSGFVYTGVLKSYDNGAEVEITEKREVNTLKPLTLYMSLIKKDKFELVCEKATELGVTKIVPITTEFSLKYNVRFDRLKKIVREASEQSERTMLPEIIDSMTLGEAINDAPQKSVVLAERKEGGTLQDVDALFVGPEGGWSEKEMKLFEEKGIEKVSLGNQILRAETAGIVSVGAIVLGSM